MRLSRPAILGEAPWCGTSAARSRARDAATGRPTSHRLPESPALLPGVPILHTIMGQAKTTRFPDRASVPMVPFFCFSPARLTGCQDLSHSDKGLLTDGSIATLPSMCFVPLIALA